MSEITKPGRELDALVAEKVMGFKALTENDSYISGVQFFGNDDIPGTYREIPRYSTDISAAWELIPRLRTQGCLLLKDTGYSSTGWRAEFCISYFSEKEVYGDTASHAICLAALKAIN